MNVKIEDWFSVCRDTLSGETVIVFGYGPVATGYMRVPVRDESVDAAGEKTLPL